MAPSLRAVIASSYRAWARCAKPSAEAASATIGVVDQSSGKDADRGHRQLLGRQVRRQQPFVGGPHHRGCRRALDVGTAGSKDLIGLDRIRAVGLPHDLPLPGRFVPSPRTLECGRAQDLRLRRAGSALDANCRWRSASARRPRSR